MLRSKFGIVQVFLDIGLPNSVYETIRTEIMTFLEENPKLYTGQGQVVNASAGDPLKVQLGVFFEYAHCGEGLHELNTLNPFDCDKVYASTWLRSALCCAAMSCHVAQCRTVPLLPVLSIVCLVNLHMN